ncbi:MAG: hypothetical protein GC159_12395 [Phycisphaera sp.]|nr:hypothetical protein [Phycisphaera sp.]
MRDDDFINLTLRYLDRVITREEMDMLNAALADDAERQRQFRELCIRSQVMRDTLGGRRAAADETAALTGAAGVAGVAGGATEPVAPGVARRLRLPVRVLAIAAAVALAATVAVTLLWPGVTHDDHGGGATTAGTGTGTGTVTGTAVATGGQASVAMVADAAGAVWGDGIAPGMMTAGGNLDAGPLRLESGVAQMMFARGAAVTLIGPTDVELTGDNRCTLRRGVLVAYVPESAHGFTVDVPGGSIVDLGTRFGVYVDDRGVAELHVLAGRVETVRPTATGPKTREITEKHAIYFGATGETIDAAFDARRWTTPKRGEPIVSGQIVMLPALPTSLAKGAFENDHHIAMFLERSGVTLRSNVKVTLTEPGAYDKYDGRGVTVPKGTKVTSYLLHYDTVGGSMQEWKFLSGAVTFDRPIVGVIAMTDQLNATDDMLGVAGVTYREGKGTARHLEDGEGDRVTISADRRTLTLYLGTSNSLDHVRVLVAADADTKAKE